ncbi:TOBE domain-containing protein [Crenobacter sp. SG2305]|uniref:TOBE domain-containing protein n=1 Tax=Crenobacter oryzisoli TaxID=3056844 RepID=UPI0025AB39FF|nr:TOBE domain-containing protein [Crenobacter sp. SG2305]MDN0084921.1 TOBE domain-containing protein [Crenobacter sp. SG2305]
MPASRHDALRLNAQVWFEQGEVNLAGSTEVGLLCAIAETGSISQAAKALGRSYKWAWDTVEAMNRLADQPLVIRETGGKHGGGTRLTERGEQLVAGYHAVERAHAAFVRALSDEAASLADLPLLKKLALKTSARNQLFGSVSAIRSGAVNDEVELALSGGEKLSVLITHRSTERINLELGQEIVALIKAQWISIAPPDSDLPTTPINRLAGTVAQIVVGPQDAEVALQLSGSDVLYGIVTLAEAATLKIGAPAVALFDAKSVILGVPF